MSMSGKTGQMSIAEYTAITDELIRRGPCKLLVFGCGNDSPVWHALNRGGVTVFIENDESWANATFQKCQDCAIAVVGYWTQRDRDGGNAALLGSPDVVLAKEMTLIYQQLRMKPFVWDVVIVDGPQAWASELPGRLQSIATAAQYSDPTSTVFVHDCDRSHEQRWARTR